VDINLSLAGHTLKMIVSDQGTGIQEQEKSHIFSAFYQGKNAKDVIAQGSGLGLTIVKESVEQLMGTLQLEQNEPQGCRFVIQIPTIIPTNKNQGVN
ncbi:hypothetical protein LCGC14_1820570, partial [marine sediment metagenome]